MKKSLIGLNAYNSKTKINNANWENSIKEETYLNNGDTVSLKASFIDSRNRVTGNINLDQDTEIELQYMFYYINRGGTPTKSLVKDNNFPNRQQLPMEYFNNGTEAPNTLGGDTTPPSPAIPAGTSYISALPVKEDTDKTSANLAPLVESVCHTYSSDTIAKWNDTTAFPVINFSDIIVGKSYKITSLGDISNELWIEAGTIYNPFVEQVFKCIASPGNEAKYPIIIVSAGTIGKTYKILSLGNGNDTYWNSVNSALDAPVTVGTIFQYDTQYSAPTITDITQFIVGSGYTITASLGYDFSSLGGPALPTNTNTPINLNTQVLQGSWYVITQLTPSLTDGTSLIDYTPYFTTAPTVGLQFISPENGQNVANIPIPTNKNGIYAINTGMSIQVTTQGLINWDALGYDSNLPTTNDIDIADAEANTNYLVIDTGGTFGMNKQFPIIELPNFLNGQIINLPAPTDIRTLIQNEDGSLTVIGDEPSAYTPPVNSLPVIDPTTLTPDYNGEYFVIIDKSDFAPFTWETMFVSVFGTGTPDDWDDGMIIQARGITATPMPDWLPGVKIQWLSFMGIPVGSTITIGADADVVLSAIWNTMGYTDNYTFTTTTQISVTNFYVGTFAEGLAVGSFSFAKTGSVLRPYTLQSPFTFTTTGTYPTNFNSTDTAWVANLIPTDEILEIQNYTFPFSFTATAVGTLSPIQYSTFSSYILPTGTIQEYYEEGVVTEYDYDRINAINSNNPVGFSNTIDANNPDGLPYLLNYCIPKNVNGTTAFDPDKLEATSIKPFIKKWKMVLKKGTYTPDYLAEVITRGMTIQRQKIQTTNIGNNRYLGTPNQSVNSQMMKATDFSYIRNKITLGGVEDESSGAQTSAKGSIPSPYYGFIPPNVEQGGFPSKNQLNGTELYCGASSKTYDEAQVYQPYIIGKAYQPNLMYNPKNKNILPGYDGNQTTLPDTLPVNPKYTALDFNNPDSQIQDDNPFIYRPNAFTQRNSLHPSEAKVRLTYNDYNLSNYNGIKPFGDSADENIKNIEMMYKPLCSDVESSYFVRIQEQFNLPLTKDYAIKPVISVPVAQLPVTNVNILGPTNLLNVVSTYSAPNSISSPVVGAPLMNLSYNQENNGLFEFTYMHTPVYAKLTEDSDDVQETVGMYPNYINTETSARNQSLLFYYATFDNTQLADALPYFVSGKIAWAEHIQEITPTSVYGYLLQDTEGSDFTPWFRNFQLIYDETRPTQYTALNPTFELFFLNRYVGASSVKTLAVGDHLIIRGSMLKGVDYINDLTITILTVTKQPDSNFLNEIRETWVYTFTLSGTPSPNVYKTFTQVSSVVQLAQQSGIIFYDMKATKADGTSTPFWENLGFNVKDITYKADTPLSYENFLNLTTRGFLGTSNIFDPDTLSGGTTEQSYIAYTDAINMLGWYAEATVGAQYNNGANFDAAQQPEFGDTGQDFQEFFLTEYTALTALGDVTLYPAGEGVGNFELQRKILYSAVETTVPVSAKTGFSDNTDAGHFLISIEGYGGTYLLTDLDKLNVKSLVSSYYTGPNAFVSNSLADSALYEHLGSPMKIQNFKVRILSAYTGEEVENLGPNSSIYLEITKNLNKNNVTNITSTN